MTTQAPRPRFNRKLRDRFVEYHAGLVTFIRAGETHEVSVARYEQVMEFLAAHRNRRVQLAVRTSGRTGALKFNGMLRDLLNSARRAGLLRGQHNRAIEDAMTKLRNGVAHPSNYELIMPVEAARTLRDLAEIINQLWGHETPGGRLYRSPYIRRAHVVAWNSATGAFCATQAPNLQAYTDWGSYTQFAIVQSVGSDSNARVHPHLERYDSRYETTPYPTDYLWGPGCYDDAVTWLAHHATPDDHCVHLDRLFVSRVREGEVSAPMRPGVAAVLGPDLQAGRWYLVRADAPDDVIGHLRHVAAGSSGRAERGPCRTCLVDTVAQGTWLAGMDAAGIDFEAPKAVLPPEFSIGIPIPYPTELCRLTQSRRRVVLAAFARST